MNRSYWVSGLGVLLAAALIGRSAFIVPEGMSAAKFGSTEWLAPGLHFHWPIGQSLVWRDQRQQLLMADGTDEQPYVKVLTFDQKGLELGYAVLWRIQDQDRYAEHYENNALAQNAIRLAINQALSQCCLSQTLSQWLDPQSLALSVNQALNAANGALAGQGLSLSQLSITAMAVPSTERDLWLDGMKERGQTALTALQSQTATLAANLKASVDHQVSQTLSDGKKQADLLRAEADNHATDIYAAAYHKNPTFYEFYSNLKAYQQVFKARQQVVVLDSQSPFLKSMTQD